MVRRSRGAGASRHSDWSAATRYRRGTRGRLHTGLGGPPEIDVRESAAVPRRGRHEVAASATAGEVRLATWDEIDTAGRIWTISAGQMKAKREHRVSLCRRAEQILDAARALRQWGNAIVFPMRSGKPIFSSTCIRNTSRSSPTWSRQRSLEVNPAIQSSYTPAPPYLRLASRERQNPRWIRSESGVMRHLVCKQAHAPSALRSTTCLVSRRTSRSAKHRPPGCHRH